MDLTDNSSIINIIPIEKHPHVIQSPARVEGFELVDGTLKWQGHADPNQTMTHTVTLKAVKPGK